MFIDRSVTVVVRCDPVRSEVSDLQPDMQRVNLSPHDPDWAIDFTRESSVVSNTLSIVLVAIHHGGSSATQEICAKPIVAMLAEVTVLSALGEHFILPAAAGYEIMSEHGIAGRRYFRKNDPDSQRTHQIHAFEIDTSQTHRHLAARDLIRAHPDFANQYDDVKRRPVELHPNDVSAGTDGTHEFIGESDIFADVCLSATLVQRLQFAVTKHSA